MRLNLSEEIVLNSVSEDFYRPKTAVDRSEITRFEKIYTDIYPSIAEGTRFLANSIATQIKKKACEGKYYVLAAGTGLSLTPVYEELIRLHKEEGLSFKNVVVFNAYEYFPLNEKSNYKSIAQLRKKFIDHVDIDLQNVFTPDGTIPQEQVQESCRLYEQRIKTFGGLDAALLGIGRSGNIACNEPGSSLASTCLLYTSPSPRDLSTSRMPSSA